MKGSLCKVVTDYKNNDRCDTAIFLKDVEGGPAWPSVGLDGKL